MRFFSTIATFFLLVTGMFAQGNEVAFQFEHRVGGQPLALDTTVFTLPDGRKALLTRAEFYISEAVLTATDGSKLPLGNFYMLVNADTPHRTYTAGNWNVSGITGLTLHLGVDAAHNHLDPSS
ncbi:MAG: MbnP family protein, partial [Saprospiraceae bacterium]